MYKQIWHYYFLPKDQAKIVKKTPQKLFRAINQKKIFLTFFLYKLQEYFVEKLKKFKSPQDQVYLSPGSLYQTVKQTLNLSRHFISY